MKKTFMLLFALVCLHGFANAQSWVGVCNPGYYGLTHHPYDCTKFFQCVNGVAYLSYCPPVLQYDRDRQVCDSPANVECFTDPEHKSPEYGLFGVSYGSQECGDGMEWVDCELRWDNYDPTTGQIHLPPCTQDGCQMV